MPEPHPTPNPKPADAPKPAAGRVRKWLSRLLVLGVTVVIMLVVCEVAVRLLLPPLIMPRYVETAPYGIRRQLPNIRGFIITSQYRHKITSNSKGFRGTREYAVPKPPGVFRVLALGDSVVNGYGVEDEQTFAALLEKKLSVHRPAEVVNLGVPGYSTAEQLIQLQQVGLELQPDLVVLGYFVNDHYENLTCGLYQLKDGKLMRNPAPPDPAIGLRDRMTKIPGYNFLCQHSYFVNAVRNQLSGYFRGRMAARRQLADGAYTSDKPTEEQLALTSALFDEFIKTCADRGIKVVILNIPMEQNGVWMENFPAGRLKLQDRAVVVDVAKEIFSAQPLWDIAHRGSYHPKPLGHELIAAWLADGVRTNRW